MQARFFSALEEATCLLDLSTLEMTELIVDTIWALAIAGHLHPHTCRAIINRAVAAGMDPMGLHMNHANCFKLVQARPPPRQPGVRETASMHSYVKTRAGAYRRAPAHAAQGSCAARLLSYVMRTLQVCEACSVPVHHGFVCEETGPFRLCSTASVNCNSSAHPGRNTGLQELAARENFSTLWQSMC